MKIVLSVLLFVTLTLNLAPQRAQGVTGVPGLIIISVPIIVLSGTALYKTISHPSAKNNPYLAFDIAVFSFMTAAGILALDKNDPSSLAYDHISEDKAQSLGIDEDQRIKFNNSRSAVNQIGKAIIKKCLNKFMKHNGHKSEAINSEDALSINECAEKNWEDFRQSNPKVLTQEVYDVVTALRSQSV